MVMKLKTAAGRREFWTCGADQSCPQWELRWRLDNSFGDEDVFVFVFVLRILLKQNTALLSTVCVCLSVCTGMTPHISHIYKGIYAM